MLMGRVAWIKWNDDDDDLRYAALYWIFWQLKTLKHVHVFESFRVLYVQLVLQSVLLQYAVLASKPN